MQTGPGDTNARPNLVINQGVHHDIKNTNHMCLADPQKILPVRFLPGDKADLDVEILDTR